jgi:catechol-2,3-dioxygenase
VTQKHAISLECAKTNTWNDRQRVDQASPAYDRATLIEVGHVVFLVTDLAATSAFYQEHLGFVVSDRYPGRGCFLRCAPEGGHHNLFCSSRPSPARV